MSVFAVDLAAGVGDVAAIQLDDGRDFLTNATAALKIVIVPNSHPITRDEVDGMVERLAEAGYRIRPGTCGPLVKGAAVACFDSPDSIGAGALSLSDQGIVWATANYGLKFHALSNAARPAQTR